MKVKAIVLFLLLLLTLTPPVAAANFAYAQDDISITLVFGDTVVTYKDEYIAPTDYTVIEQFYYRAINAPREQKVKCIERNLASGATPRDAVLYTLPRLSRAVNEIISAIARPAVDATITFNASSREKFTVTPEQIGYAPDEQKIYYDIYKSLRTDSVVRVEIMPKVLQPAVTAEKLRAQTHLRASFSTDYSRSSGNRKHNIRLALSKINGTVIAAGEQFSFNKIVGSRSKQNGYADAKIIVDGEYTDGVGGGVCQASTTVYNCALLADMRIKSVRPHSLVPSYVPPSFDAMVSGSYSDLTFINDTAAPVYLACTADDNTATVSIYGLKNEYSIVRSSVIVSKTQIPPDKEIIDSDNSYNTATYGKVRLRYGVAGTASEGYLLYYKGGKLVRKELIRRDNYAAQQGVVAISPTFSENSTDIA